MRLGLLIITLGLAAATISADPPTTQDLQQQLQQANHRLDQQQQELAQLRATLGQNWLNQARQEQLRQLVREVLADAETRATLLDTPIIAGHDGSSFFLSSEDGKFLLRFKGMVQARHVYNTRDDSGADDNLGGFEDGRTRFSFSGHVVDPTWTFLIWTGHHCNGDQLLLDAWITKALDDNWSVTVGQFKAPLWREWMVSETSQQFVERSLLSAAFGGSYTQGVKVDYASEQFRSTLSFNDGAATLNTTWNTPDTDYAFSGRAELLLAGSWKPYGEFESWRGEELMAVVGAAAHYQMGEYGTSTDESQIVRWTVDGTLEFGGVNLFAAFIGNHVSNGTSLDQYGLLVQGGVFLTDKLELIARYEWGDSDTPTDQTLSVVTVGTNYFFARHRLRLTADVSYALEPVSATWANSFAGYLPDAAGQDGQIVVRTQMQLIF